MVKNFTNQRLEINYFWLSSDLQTDRINLDDFEANEKISNGLLIEKSGKVIKY